VISRVGLVDDLLRRREIQEAPPVLVDIGAAGPLHPKWRPIAPYAICVAFEANPEEASDSRSGFREVRLRAAVVAERAERASFYLTRFPFCSSRLRPNESGLRPYAFSALFELERIDEVETVALPDVLSELGVGQVDWFKTDSQGTDLRLFASLGQDIIERVLVADFEPGIIDAYEGEDKLADVLSYMDELSFWMSDLTIEGSPRVERKVIERLLPPRLRARIGVSLRAAPGWGEVQYFNDFTDDTLFGKREYLLGCAFGWACGHYGFALELASRGHSRFGDGDGVFAQVEEAATKRIRRGFAALPLAAARSWLRR
jgi:FkbM family methyltransferase